MHLPKIARVGIALLLGGCAFVPSPYSAQLNPVAERYSSFKMGELLAVYETQLGKPTRVEDDGSCVWETRFDDLNYARLKVRFGSDGKAQKTEITRAHGQRFENSHSSAVTTRTK